MIKRFHNDFLKGYLDIQLRPGSRDMCMIVHITLKWPTSSFQGLSLFGRYTY